METVCVYHSIDLDGWMSAAIVKHWFNLNNETKLENNSEHGVLGVTKIKLSNNSINFIGYNYGQLTPDLSEYDSIIIVDVSFPKEEMRKLFEQHTNSFVWLDHHISAIKEISNNVPMEFTEEYAIKHAACELTWKYFFPNEPMPEIVRLLGRYDCFGHKGTDEEQKVLEFQYGARQCISNYEEAYKYLMRSIPDSRFPNNDKYITDPIEPRIQDKGKAIYAYLCTEAKQVYKNGFKHTFAEPTGEIHKGNPVFSPRTFICINKERFNPINFGIDYHKDGYDGAACFHYDGVAKLWRFSLYNDNGKVDCSMIAKQFGGGGHKGAAGFVTKDLNYIIS